VTRKQRRILELSDLIRDGDWWTTYTAMSLAVYGHEKGRQTVGSTLKYYGEERSAHRILERGGRIAGDWIGVGGGPEEAKRRLCTEGIWDEVNDCARADRYLDADGIRRLEPRAHGGPHPSIAQWMWSQ
jgi:hypothetical protein